MSVVVERGTELGQGLYGLADLRAFLSISGSKNDGAHALAWLTRVLNPVGHHRLRPDYSFGDLISLFVVRELKRQGVRTGDIREAEAYLRRKWNTDRPFVSGEIKTDGRGIFVDDDLIAGQIEAAERHGQQVMRQAVSDRLTAVHYDEGGIAAYWTPAEHVLVDPRVQFGEPVVAGTRIPTLAIADMGAYLHPSQIASELDIPVGRARAALRFERRLAALRN